MTGWAKLQFVFEMFLVVGVVVAAFPLSEGISEYLTLVVIGELAVLGFHGILEFAKGLLGFCFGLISKINSRRA